MHEQSYKKYKNDETSRARRLAFSVSCFILFCICSLISALFYYLNDEYKVVKIYQEPITDTVDIARDEVKDEVMQIISSSLDTYMNDDYHNHQSVYSYFEKLVKDVTTSNPPTLGDYSEKRILCGFYKTHKPFKYSAIFLATLSLIIFASQTKLYYILIEYLESFNINRAKKMDISRQNFKKFQEWEARLVKQMEDLE